MKESLKKLSNSLFMSLFRTFNSREVTVVQNSEQQSRDYYKYEQVISDGMSLQTENFLRGNMLQSSLRSSPQEVLEQIDVFYQISGDPVYLLIAADVCRFFSLNKTLDRGVPFYLAAFYYCQKAFRSKEKTEKDHIQKVCQHLQELQIYNETSAGIFRYLKEMDLLDSTSFSLHSVNGIEFIFEKPEYNLSVPRSAVSDFSLCSDFCVKALRLLNRHSGIGIPLVAKIMQKKQHGSLRIPPGMTIPVTLFFRFKIISEKKISLLPCYQDTSISETFPLQGECLGMNFWILARDFTTPLACFMNTLTQRNLLSGMLNSVKYEQTTGLYMVEPYRPDKIPVVFVHGLMSSPETWGQMINSLKYDSKIREKYQFWFFSYSTGVPILYSSKKLRTALLEARKEYCTTPEAERNFEKMVIVGHSMGGLLTRLLLLADPYRAVEKITGKSWEEMQKMTRPEDLEILKRLWPCEPLDFVKRVVFMAVPHLGSAVAKNQIAKLGIRLIKLPDEIMKNKETLLRIWKAIMPQEKFCWRTDSFITGIENLKPNGVFARWAGNAPLSPHVIYHSIIGNRKTTAIPGGSDGIVPYWSSHLDNVASECVVKSGHSVHRNPEAIRELLRILLLHLEENEPQK